MTYKAICLTLSFLILGTSAQAVELCGHKAQGNLLLGKGDNLHQVSLNGKNIPFNEDGYFLLAMERDAPLTQKLSISINDAEHNYPQENITFTIAKTPWDIQKINGVAERKVTPKQEDMDEILRENQSVRKALETNLAQSSFWQNGFILPLDNYRVSGKFGGQRIINTHPKSAHKGMDMAAPEGTPIKSSAEGIITLSGGNFFYSGNMVIIDHGDGLQTMYAHLKDTNVKVGDHVKQGEIIGTVGHTGRATGPHLHWGASHNGVRFNPESLLTFQTAKDCTSF